MSSFETLVPDTLTVRTYARFAPFAYEEDGRIVGSDISFLTRFAAVHDLDARFEMTDFPDIWTQPSRGECDIAAAGIAALAQRDPGPGAGWSAAYSVVRRALLIRKSDIDALRRPQDFAGRSIVVTASSSADIDARTRYEALGASIVAALPSQGEMVRRLLEGEIDAYAGGETSHRFVAETQPDLAVVDVHSMEPPETLHFAVRRADPRLLEALNKFIEQARGSESP